MIDVTFSAGIEASPMIANCVFGNSIVSGSIIFAYCPPTAIIVEQLFEVSVRIRLVRSAMVPSVTTL